MKSVVTFYRFVALTDLEALREDIERAASDLNIKGTVLLAEEGINGTLAGTSSALATFTDWLVTLPPFANLRCRYSSAEADDVFYRLKVRIKPEIVNMGQPEVEVAARTGTHVDPARWNELLDDPDVVVIDTRNDYEIGIGTFPGAVNPGTRSFRQFPDFAAGHLDPGSQPRVAMFCTGGIRCEKASAYLLEQGFDEVYQLDGGVLTYLETVTPEDNRWQGECFVFDQRVSVTEALAQGSFQQCYACRRPLAAEDLSSESYVEGVSCPLCVDEHNEQQRAAFRERARQIALAEQRGERHIGETMPASR